MQMSLHNVQYLGKVGKTSPHCPKKKRRKNWRWYWFYFNWRGYIQTKLVVLSKLSLEVLDAFPLHNMCWVWLHWNVYTALCTHFLCVGDTRAVCVCSHQRRIQDPGGGGGHQARGHWCYLVCNSGHCCYLVCHSGHWCYLVCHSGHWCYLVCHSGHWCYLLCHSGHWCYLVCNSGHWCYLVCNSGHWCYLVCNSGHWYYLVCHSGHCWDLSRNISITWYASQDTHWLGHLHCSYMCQAISMICCLSQETDIVGMQVRTLKFSGMQVQTSVLYGDYSVLSQLLWQWLWVWLWCCILGVLRVLKVFCHRCCDSGCVLSQALWWWSWYSAAGVLTLWLWCSLKGIVAVINMVFCHRCCGPRGLIFMWWWCCGLCFWHKPTELAHSFYSVLVSISVFMALSTVFHFINSLNNSPLSHSVLPVFFCLIGPFNYISFHESLLQPWYNPLWLTGLKALTN